MMFRPHYGTCICHGLKRLIVVKKGYCKQGNDERKGKTRGVKAAPGRSDLLPAALHNDKTTGRNGKKVFARRGRKVTGEMELFKKLYTDKGPYSEISGQYIAFDVRCFSHILSKGAYPKFRLYEKNIVLKTPKEHHLWETQRHKLKALPEWEWVFILEQELKQEYYQKQKP